MATPVMNYIRLSHSHLHFPQLSPLDGTCGKIVRPKGESSERRCGQDKNGSRHLYYPCPNDDCDRRFLSIDMRDSHVEHVHG